MALATFLEALGIGERRCSHCLAPWFPREAAALPLCPACQPCFQRFGAPACKLCGLPLSAPGQRLCESCRKEKPPWSGMAFFGLYEGALRDIILRLKFDGELNLARLLAELLLEACACLPRPDVIIPIPQHPRGLLRRGFNQTREIGRFLARLSGLPLDYSLLKRVRSGPPQESLDAARRRTNLKDAFFADPRISGRRLWLLDDVVTTGSTCRHAAGALLAAGAADVYVLACARTPLS